MPRNIVDPSVKAAAIADLEAGLTLREIGAKHNVAASTVLRWGRAAAAPPELRTSLEAVCEAFLAYVRSEYQECQRLLDEACDLEFEASGDCETVGQLAEQIGAAQPNGDVVWFRPSG